jgi:cell division septal protein FtsQ
MSQRRSKILGLLLFVIILTALSFTALSPGKKNGAKQIKSILVSGNHLLPQNSYLSFSKLLDVKNSPEVDLAIVKDRLEKHPFISSAEVEMSESGNVRANLLEKSFSAVLIIDGITYLMSDELQMLPLMANTKLDFPVISNPKHGKQYKVLNYLQSSEIIEAYNILLAAKSVNEDMFKRLSKINLNYGEDITLTFSDIHPVIKFGYNDIPKKIIELEKIWSEIKNENRELSQSDYIDLRYLNQIYFLKAEEEKSEL